MLTALVSFGISTYTFLAASRPPEVSVIPPRQVRIAQGGPQGAYAYIQPVLVGSGRGERAEVVVDLRVSAQSLPMGGEVELVWDEVGSWAYDPATQELYWTYVADPGPIVLTARTAQAPVLLFVGPPGWSFEPGKYLFTLTAQLAVGAPVAASLEVTITKEDIRVLNEAEGGRFLTFPADE